MLFTIIPFFASLYLAFTDYNLFTEPNFVGLANFQAMFEDPRLLQSLKAPSSTPLSQSRSPWPWRWGWPWS